MNSDVVFFLPIRKGSERVIHKNTRKFAEYEGGLVELKLRQLMQVRDIPIILSTNDPKTIRIAERFRSSQIKIIERPEELCRSSTKLEDLIAYVPTVIQAQHIIWTHVTSPLIDSGLYKIAVKRYREALKMGFDSLLCIVKLQEFIWDAETNKGLNFNNNDGTDWPRTQDLDPLWIVNSAFFINSRENYLNYGNRIGKHPYLFELNKNKAIDIDDETDFEIAQALFQRRKKDKAIEDV